MDGENQTGSPGPFATDRESLERDTHMELIRAGGPGGQHRNKRETGVRLTHAQSGVTVTATERRSQARNRDQAFERLAARLEEMNQVPKERKPTRAPAHVDERRLLEKRITASRKALRKPPEDVP